MVLRQAALCSFILIATLVYIHNQENSDQAKEFLGIVCCFVTILFFAAPLASMLHVIRVKNTESLPFPIIFANFVVSLQWLVYGIIINDKFVQVFYQFCDLLLINQKVIFQVPNFLGVILSGLQLSLFCFYPKTSKGHLNEYV